MFRDLKEYQEILKIYADKVSKPEDLEENQANRMKMKELRTSNTPKTREEVGLKPKVTSFADRRAARTGYKKPEKPIPTTAEIRAKSTTGMSNIPSKEGSAVIGGKKINPNFGKKSEIKPEVKTPVTPVKKMGRIEKQNRARLGDEKVDALKKKNSEFQAAKKSGNLAQFKKDNPKMSGADRAKQMAKDRLAKKAAMEEFTPYDIVLEYLLSSEQAATIEEANYIMTEMDAETIQSIVSN
tara:strand:+ start:2170 stop:2889 length:720 start_codon:yes stop_codon:yes gene_type:complete